MLRGTAAHLALHRVELRAHKRDCIDGRLRRLGKRNTKRVCRRCRERRCQDQCCERCRSGAVRHGVLLAARVSRFTASPLAKLRDDSGQRRCVGEASPAARHAGQARSTPNRQRRPQTAHARALRSQSVAHDRRQDPNARPAELSPASRCCAALDRDGSLHTPPHALEARAIAAQSRRTRAPHAAPLGHLAAVEEAA